MIGTPSNVWQVASCIYVLIRHGRHLDTNNFFRHHIGHLNKTIETYGQNILQPEFSRYSASLRELILHCLARDPTERPSPREVLLRCEEQLKQFIRGPDRMG
jgi:serine/threonine protein kinase